MPTSRSRRGLKAEIIAAAELGRRGYKIIDSNYRCRYGEIDLIASEGGMLVFVEVRSRSSSRFGDPAESITASKREKLLLTAQHFMSERDIRTESCRFDVVTIVFCDGSGPEIAIIRDAFQQ